MRALEFKTGPVIYNPAYTSNFQLKTTYNLSKNESLLNFFNLIDKINNLNAKVKTLFLKCLLFV